VTRHSLRLRLIAGGVLAILLALAVAGGGLVVLFERHVARNLAADLDVYLKQLIAGIEIDPQGHLDVARSPSDPRFAEPLSGLYWQIADSQGTTLRSRSLWDTTITLPADTLASGDIHYHEVGGPRASRLLAAERVVTLSVGDRREAVQLVVAIDMARVSTAASAFARDLVVALGILGLVLTVATIVQVSLGLHPLDTLRRGIADIRAARSSRLPGSVPLEVGPLVEELNALLDAQDHEIERSRRRAGDLAHGLKTPLAALAADAARLRERGEQAVAQDIEALGDTMSRHVDRELARARVRGSQRPGAAAPASELAPLADSLIATLKRTPSAAHVTFESHFPPHACAPLDRTDLAEVLGNLLENASRHAQSRVRIGYEVADGSPAISIEDDGPGIPADDLVRVIQRGMRLDRRGGGAGLGLAIVEDIMEAYDWQLNLGRSELGGLKATIGPRRASNRGSA
jgi:signal transduction histidine kinase